MRLFLLLVLPFFLFSCAKETATSQAPISKPSSVTQEPLKEGWEQEWGKILQNAKKEGKVVIYTSGASSLIFAMQKGFKEKYGINAEFISGRGEELLEKIKSERRADLFLPDLVIGGSDIPLLLIKPQGFLDKLEPLLLLPEVTEPKVWWKSALPWLDKDYTSLGFSLFVSIPIAYNTNLVKAEEMKSYRELLKPKFKGKIVMDDPTVSGVGIGIISVLGAKIMGWDFIRELAQQDPVIQRDARLEFEWLAQGKHFVLVAVKPELSLEFKQAGAPIETIVPEEGGAVTSGTGVIAAFNRRPHDNAARLFINWLLTKEGQRVFARAYSAPSARVDVPTEGLNPVTIPKPGVEYFRNNDEDFVIKRGEYMKTAREIFGQKR